MDNHSEQNPELSRRELLKGATAAGLALSAGVGGVSQAAAATPDADNPIRKENAKPGTRDWLLTKTDIAMNEPVELWRSPRIEGYCSATSVSAGDKAGKGRLKAPHIATFYNGPKGNVVFDAGSIWWSQGLSSPPGHVLPAIGGAKPKECNA